MAAERNNAAAKQTRIMLHLLIQLNKKSVTSVTRELLSNLRNVIFFFYNLVQIYSPKNSSYLSRLLKVAPCLLADTCSVVGNGFVQSSNFNGEILCEFFVSTLSETRLLY